MYQSPKPKSFFFGFKKRRDQSHVCTKDNHLQIEKESLKGREKGKA